MPGSQHPWESLRWSANPSFHRSAARPSNGGGRRAGIPLAVYAGQAFDPDSTVDAKSQISRNTLEIELAPVGPTNPICLIPMLVFHISTLGRKGHRTVSCTGLCIAASAHANAVTLIRPYTWVRMFLPNVVPRALAGGMSGRPVGTSLRGRAGPTRERAVIRTSSKAARRTGSRRVLRASSFQMKFLAPDRVVSESRTGHSRTRSSSCLRLDKKSF